MPRIIGYDTVLKRLQEQNLRCLYHNAGAFGFPPGAQIHILGWIGPDDPTIRQEMRPHTRQIPPPHPKNLTTLATTAWRTYLSADAWVMPMSHWAFELDHGSRQWMPHALRQIGINPAELETINNAAAICFTLGEPHHFSIWLEELLQNLTGSDFMIAFPGQNILCTIHHHQQLWWQTTSPDLLAQLTRHVP